MFHICVWLLVAAGTVFRSSCMSIMLQLYVYLGLKLWILIMIHNCIIDYVYAVSSLPMCDQYVALTLPIPLSLILVTLFKMFNYFCNNFSDAFLLIAQKTCCKQNTLEWTVQMIYALCIRFASLCITDGIRHLHVGNCWLCSGNMLVSFIFLSVIIIVLYYIGSICNVL